MTPPPATAGRRPVGCDANGLPVCHSLDTAGNRYYSFGSMPKSQLLPHFVRLLFIALLAVAPCFLSCNGNGGSHDGGGATYVPGGGGGSSCSSGGDSQNQFTPEELWNYSNAGNADRIIDLVSTEAQETEETQTIVLKAADIGLPAGGTATLTISGGVTFSGTVQADADGNVSFVIPATRSGITITVKLTVANSSGTVLYSGSSQETLSGDSLDIGLTLHRQYWTLPASISLTASPAGFVYDNTKLDETTMLSIAGLEDAPAGAAISYAWELDAGPLSDSGPYITRSWNDLIGPATLTAELTRTFTVTVSYTDIAGEAKTASASTDVIIGPPVTIPSFTIKVNPPTSYDTANSNVSQYALMNNSDPFSFEVELPVGESFPAGTVLSWSITKVGSGGGTVTASGPSVSKTPAELGVTTSVETWNITCTASNSRAAAPVIQTRMMQSKLLALPDFIIQLDSVTGYNANNSSGDTYAFMPSASGAFNLKTAITSGTAISGMSYSWSVSDNGSFSHTGDTCTLSTSDLTSLDSKTYASPGSWTVTCELSYGSLTPVTKTCTVSAFTLCIPDLKLTDNTSLSVVTAKASGEKFYVWDADTDTLSYTVESDDPAGIPIPTGVTYSWSIGNWSEADGSSTESPTVSSVGNFSPVSGPDYTGTARCTISMDGLTDKSTPPVSLNLLSKGAMPMTEPDVTISAGSGLTEASSLVFTMYSDSASLSFTFNEDQPIEEVEYLVSMARVLGGTNEGSYTKEELSSISLSTLCGISPSVFPSGMNQFILTITAKSTVTDAFSDSPAWTQTITIMR